MSWEQVLNYSVIIRNLTGLVTRRQHEEKKVKIIEMRIMHLTYLFLLSCSVKIN